MTRYPRANHATETGLSGLYCTDAHDAYIDDGTRGLVAHFRGGCATCNGALDTTGERAAWNRLAALAASGPVSFGISQRWQVESDAEEWNDTGRHHD